MPVVREPTCLPPPCTEHHENPKTARRGADSRGKALLLLGVADSIRVTASSPSHPPHGPIQQMHARIDRGQVQLRTRTGLDWTAKYPTAVTAQQACRSGRHTWTANCVPFSENGVTSFGNCSRCDAGFLRPRPALRECQEPSVLCLGERIAGIFEVIAALGWRVCAEQRSDDVPEILARGRRSRSQQRLQLGEQLLNWVEIRTVGRKIQDACPDGSDCLGNSGNLVRAEISITTTSRGASAGGRNCST
jgi:hypothetical protein